MADIPLDIPAPHAADLLRDADVYWHGAGTTESSWIRLFAHERKLRLAAEAEVARLRALLDCPHNADWFEGVRIEAAHQQERWGTSHDEGKEPQDWFWLIGYLAGKALRAAIDGDTEKAKHHTISTAAACLNWYRRITGQPGDMRPGIAPPAEQEPPHAG